MAEATNELMYELPKSIHQWTDRFDAALSEVRQEITSVCQSMMGVQTDIDGMLARHDERFDRIDRREFAEPRRPIHP